jgi:hypothetical protein
MHKKTIINLIQNLLQQWFQLLFKITLLISFLAHKKKSNCIISLKFCTIKHELKKKILEELLGTHEDSFEMLPRLLLAIQELNPRTIIE